MLRFNQEFKVQSVEKVFSKQANRSVKNIADDLGVGYSTLQKWIRLAKDNKLEKATNIMSKEKSPQDWNTTQRFDAITHCHTMDNAQLSTYCRGNGIYPHHIKAWKTDFLSTKETSQSASKQEQRKLKQEVKRLQKELNRKDRALSETAALLVLSKKCQAIWGEKEDV